MAAFVKQAIDDIRSHAELAAKKAAKKAPKKPKAKAKAKAKKAAKKKAAKKSAAATKKAADAKLKAARKKQSDAVTAIILEAAKKPTSKEGFEHAIEAVDKFKASMTAGKDKISSKAVVEGVNAAAKKLAVPAKLKAGTPLTSALHRVVSIVMDHFIAGDEREKNMKDKADKKATKQAKAKAPVSAGDAAKRAAAISKHTSALKEAKTDSAKFEAALADLTKDKSIDAKGVYAVAFGYIGGRETWKTRKAAIDSIKSRFNERNYQDSKMALLKKDNFNIVV